MTTRRLAERTSLWVAAALCLSLAAGGQTPRGDWSTTGGNAGQTGWQKAERGLSRETVGSRFKFLWKIELGAPAQAAQSFQEPLLASRLINGQGFKDFVYVTSADSLYGVDSELGSLLWTKRYAGARGCGMPGVSAVMEAPAVINFNARRAPGTPPPAPVVAQTSSERRLGVAAGGGYFAFKGIYALTGDGMLHEQVLTTGADFAAAVKFLPGPGGHAGLTVAGKTVYTAMTMPCPGTPGGVFALDMSAASYPVASYAAGTTLSVTGAITAPDGTAYVVTGAGAGEHPNSVVALGRDMKVKDWYTLSAAAGSPGAVSPVLFAWETSLLIAAPGKDGSVVLLDGTALGGADHRTPLTASLALSPAGEKHSWDSFASWQDTDGSVWVLAAVSAPVTSASLKGAARHGAVVAFKVEDADGKPALRPVWMSHDMVNPAPPRVANGVVIALAGGDARTHAVLTVLNATTGEELYTSGDSIPTFTHLSGIAVGDGHAFFTDHHGVLYAFGIALEH